MLSAQRPAVRYAGPHLGQTFPPGPSLSVPGASGNGRTKLVCPASPPSDPRALTPRALAVPASPTLPAQALSGWFMPDILHSLLNAPSLWGAQQKDTSPWHHPPFSCCNFIPSECLESSDEYRVSPRKLSHHEGRAEARVASAHDFILCLGLEACNKNLQRKDQLT